jgi:hypothetical protein
MASLFYFHSESDHSCLDPDGTELADVAAAQQEALGLLGRMLQDDDGACLWQGRGWSLWVTDAPNGAGHVFFKIQLSASAPTEPD